MSLFCKIFSALAVTAALLLSGCSHMPADQPRESEAVYMVYSTPSYSFQYDSADWEDISSVAHEVGMDMENDAMYLGSVKYDGAVVMASSRDIGIDGSIDADEYKRMYIENHDNGNTVIDSCEDVSVNGNSGIRMMLSAGSGEALSRSEVYFFWHDTHQTTVTLAVSELQFEDVRRDYEKLINGITLE